MNERLSPINVLNAADEILRKVISQTEGVADKPAKEWTIAERRYSMEDLARAAAHAIKRFEEWSQRDVWIKNAGRIVGCLDSVRTTARHATFGPGSRTWGRTQLRSDVRELKRIFGDGCTLDPEAITHGGEQLPHSESTSTQAATPVVNTNERLYTVNELVALHNFSRRTIVRLYENEPGVQVLQASQEHQKKVGRRTRRLRVPRRVYLRVKNRMEIK